MATINILVASVAPISWPFSRPSRSRGVIAARSIRAIGEGLHRPPPFWVRVCVRARYPISWRCHQRGNGSWLSLSLAGASLHADLQAGRLVLVDPAASGAGQYAYFETAFDTSLRGGARALRLVGDMTWCLERGMTPDELVAFEAAYDQRFGRGRPIAALCLYDVRRFSSLSLLHALRGHPDTFRQPVEQWIS